jgi:(d)CTP diphosphatase
LNSGSQESADDLPTTGEHRKPAVIGVSMRDQRFLVIRRSPNVLAPGKWCLPGGGVEPNESHPAALRRELREELGLEVEPGRLLWHDISPWETPLYWWSVHVSLGAEIRLNVHEVSECCWRTAESLLVDPDLLISAVPFLRAYLKGQIDWP